jgi:hypothetical protein
MAEGRLSDSTTVLSSVYAADGGARRSRSMLRWRKLKNNDLEELEQKLRTMNPAFSKRAPKGLRRHESASSKKQSTSVKTKNKVPLSAPTMNRKSTSKGRSTPLTNHKSGNKSTTTPRHDMLGSNKDKSASSKRTHPSTAASPIRSDIVSPAPTTNNTSRQSSPEKARSTSSVRVYGPPASIKHMPLSAATKRQSLPAQYGTPSSTKTRPSFPPRNEQITVKSRPRPSSPAQRVRQSQGTKKTSISNHSRHSMARQGGQDESTMQSQSAPAGTTRNGASASHPKKQAQRQVNNGRERSLANFVSRPSARKAETQINQSGLLGKQTSATITPVLQKIDGPNDTLNDTSLSSRLKKLDGPEQTLTGIVPPNASARDKRRAAMRRMLEEKEQADAAPMVQLDSIVRPVISFFTCKPPSVQSILSNSTPCAYSTMKFNLECCNDDDESIRCGSASRKSALTSCGNNHDSSSSYSSTLYSCGGNDQSTTCGSSTGSTLQRTRCGQEEQSSTDCSTSESSEGQNSQGQETSQELEQEKFTVETTISKAEDSVTVIPLHTAAILLKAAAIQNGGVMTSRQIEGESIDSSIVEEEVWSQGGRNKYSRQVLQAILFKGAAKQSSDTTWRQIEGESIDSSIVEEDVWPLGGRNKYSRQVLQTIGTETDSEQPDEEEVYTVGGKNRYSRQASSHKNIVPKAISISDSSSTISESTETGTSSGMSASLYDL